MDAEVCVGLVIGVLRNAGDGVSCRFPAKFMLPQAEGTMPGKAVNVQQDVIPRTKANNPMAATTVVIHKIFEPNDGF